MPELGKATYEIVLNTRKFERDLKKTEKETDRSTKNMSSDFRDAESSVDSLISKIGRTGTGIRSMSRGAERDFNALERKIKKLNRSDLDVQVNLGLDRTLRDLNTLRGRLLDLHERSYDVDVNVRGSAFAELAAIRLEMVGLNKHILVSRNGFGMMSRIFGRGGVVMRGAISGVTNAFEFLGKGISFIGDIGSKVFEALQGPIGKVGMGVFSLSSKLGELLPFLGRLGPLLGVIIAAVALLIAGIVALIPLIVAWVASLGQAIVAVGALGVALIALLLPALAGGGAAILRFKDTVEDAGSAASKLKDAAKSLATTFKDVTAGGADAALLGIRDAVTMLEPMLRKLKDNFTALGQSIGNMVRYLGQQFSSPFFTEAFGKLLNAGRKAFGPLGKIIVNLSKVLTNIAVAAMPYLLAGFRAIAGGLKGWAQGTSNTKKLSNTIGGLVEHLSVWWDLLKNIAGMFGDLFGLVADEGKGATSWLNDAVVQLREFINSDLGKSAIKTFFQEMIPLAVEFLGFVGKLIVLFLQFVQFAAPAFTGIFKIFNFVLDVLNFIMVYLNKLPTFVKGFAVPFSFIPKVINLIITVVKLLVSVMASAAKSVASAWAAARGSLAVVWNAIRNIAVNTWAKVKNAVVNSVRSAVNWLKTAWTNVKGFLASLWASMKAGVVNFAKGLRDGVVNAVKGGLNEVISFLNSVIGILNKLPFIEIGTIGSVGGGSSGKTGTTAGRSMGVVRNRATGGNYAPQALARGGRVNQPTAIVGEEAPAHPEFVIATNPAYRSRNIQYWMQAGHMLGVPGYAEGGIMGALSDVAGVIAGAVNPVSLASKVLGTLPSPAGAMPGWLEPMGAGILGKAKDWVMEKASVTNLLSSVISSMGGAGSFESWVDSHTVATTNAVGQRFGLSMTSGYRSPGHNKAVGGVSNSLHTHGSPSNPGATDSVGSSSGMSSAMSFARSNIPLNELLTHDVGSGLHMHMGFFAKGGKVGDKKKEKRIKGFTAQESKQIRALQDAYRAALGTRGIGDDLTTLANLQDYMRTHRRSKPIQPGPDNPFLPDPAAVVAGMLKRSGQSRGDLMTMLAMAGGTRGFTDDYAVMRLIIQQSQGRVAQTQADLSRGKKILDDLRNKRDDAKDAMKDGKTAKARAAAADRYKRLNKSIEAAKTFVKLQQGTLKTSQSTLDSDMIRYGQALTPFWDFRSTANQWPVPLAKGGVVSSPTLALVGEAGTEIVAPENMLREIVSEGGSKRDVTLNYTFTQAPEDPYTLLRQSEFAARSAFS